MKTVLDTPSKIISKALFSSEHTAYKASNQGKLAEVANIACL